MTLELYDMTKMHPYNLMGMLIKKTLLCGIINNYPIRRLAVPFESIDMYLNNNREIRVYIKDPELNIVNVSGATGIFTLKQTKDKPVIFSKSTAISGQGTIGSPDQGELIFYIKPEDTIDLDSRQYVFDVRLILGSGDTYTVLEGVINLQQPVN